MLISDEPEDRAYYLRRAQEERAAAAAAKDQTALLAHLQMAEGYEERAAQADDGPYLAADDSAGPT